MTPRVGGRLHAPPSARGAGGCHVLTAESGVPAALQTPLLVPLGTDLTWAAGSRGRPVEGFEARPRTLLSISVLPTEHGAVARILASLSSSGSFGSSHGGRPTGRVVAARCGLDVRLPDWRC